MPGVPATGLHYAAGVSPVRARAFAGAMAIGALLRTVPYAILGQGLSTGSIATILIAGGSVALGAVVGSHARAPDPPRGCGSRLRASIAGTSW